MKRIALALLVGLMPLAAERLTVDTLWTFPLSSPSFGSACVGELDGDSFPEIAFGAYFGSESLYVFDAESGNLKWGFYAGGRPLDASVIFLDVQGDGSNEVLFAASWGILFCLNRLGTWSGGFPRPAT